MTKNCSTDREKLLKFVTEGPEFAKILRSLEHMAGQTLDFITDFWDKVVLTKFISGCRMVWDLICDAS